MFLIAVWTLIVRRERVRGRRAGCVWPFFQAALLAAAGSQSYSWGIGARPISILAIAGREMQMQMQLLTSRWGVSNLQLGQLGHDEIRELSVQIPVSLP